VPIHKELSGRSSKALLSDLNPRPRGTPASCISISAREATNRHVCKLQHLQSSSTVPTGSTIPSTFANFRNVQKSPSKCYVNFHFCYRQKRSRKVRNRKNRKENLSNKYLSNVNVDRSTGDLCRLYGEAGTVAYELRLVVGVMLVASER
jgi:hypothetical protein